jgi:hypothetical protein
MKSKRGHSASPAKNTSSNPLATSLHLIAASVYPKVKGLLTSHDPSRMTVKLVQSHFSRVFRVISR